MIKLISDVESDRERMELLYKDAQWTLAYKFATEHVPHLCAMIEKQTEMIKNKNQNIKKYVDIQAENDERIEELEKGLLSIHEIVKHEEKDKTIKQILRQVEKTLKK